MAKGRSKATFIRSSSLSRHTVLQVTFTLGNFLKDVIFLMEEFSGILLRLLSS